MLACYHGLFEVDRNGVDGFADGFESGGHVMIGLCCAVLPETKVGWQKLRIRQDSFLPMRILYTIDESSATLPPHALPASLSLDV